MTGPRPQTAVELVYRIQELADYIVPFAIRIACDLGVADLLRAGPRAVTELAEATGSHAPTLCRVLRALATKDVFVEVEPEVFGLTPAAQLFRGDHPLSLRDAYTMIPANFEAWAHIAYTVRTGEPVFPRVHGVSYYDHLAAHPEDSVRFDGIQQSGSRLELRAMLRAYDWQRFGSLVDVGGGNGAFLAGLLGRHRHLRGVLLDLPHVVKGAGAVLGAAGVESRCDVVGVDFFTWVPAGHDAYVLKRVLYDWDDSDAAALLVKVREAMRPDSRLLLLDPLVDPRPELGISKIYDLLSLAMLGGRARTGAEVAALCEGAGFTVAQTIDTTMFPLVEAVPR